jgi:hypothetical protein
MGDDVGVDRRSKLALGSIFALVATLTGEVAAAPDEPRAPGIWGGEVAGVCGLPTVVWLPAAGCSGVLIAPEIVLTAAHCTQSLAAQTVVFGEDADAPALVRETVGCVANPDWSGLADASDFGYCRLAEGVELPLVPVARGCELDALAPGQAAIVAGFGEDEQGVYGIKRWVEVTISSVEGELIRLGGDGSDSCQGDSGGPTLIELAGGWRVVALTSGGYECGQGGVAVSVEAALRFAEDETGLDLDPCRDASGAWAPRASCRDFAAAPLEPLGEWADGCLAAPRAEPVLECEAPDPEGCACSADDRGSSLLSLGCTLLLLGVGCFRTPMKRKHGKSGPALELALRDRVRGSGLHFLRREAHGHRSGP